MNETPESADSTPQFPAPVVARKNRLRLSWVWLVPIVAVLVGAVLLARSLLQQGPEIEIEFHTAEGIEPGRTEVRFKEVVVGRVTDVRITRDRQHVVVSARLIKSAEQLAVKDSGFFVVRPRIGTGGVSGLGTLFSGAYIGVDAGQSDETQRHFVGLEVAPFVLRGEPGRSFSLDAEDLGSLDVGAPVYYRRARVGRVVGFALDPVRDVLTVRVFIEAPNDKLVTQRSRFWNASGIDVALNAGGLTVNTQSIASVVAGGIAFANPDASPGELTPAPDGAQFHMFSTREAALAPPQGEALRVRMVFNESLRGLAVNAPLDLLGVEVGAVRSISLMAPDRARGRIPIEVTADLFPMRLGAIRERFLAAHPPGPTGHPDALLVRELVRHGLRAQVRNGSLLTGQMFVALDFMPKAAPAGVDEKSQLLTLPTVEGSFADLQPQIASIVSRLGKVRFDEIGDELQATLHGARTATGTLNDTLQRASTLIDRLTPEAQQALAEVRDTLKSARATLDNLNGNVASADAPIQRQAQQALAELQRAAQALRVLSDYLERHPESLLRGKPADRPDTAAKEGTR